MKRTKPPAKHAAHSKITVPACQSITVAFDKLRISPSKNVRNKKSGGLNIGTLAAMIQYQGLLNPLTVVPHAEGKAQHYDIVAGGRRYRALAQLVAQKNLAKDAPIACRLIEDALATAASLAENIGREAMHPADQFVAFKKLIDEGKSVADVAAAYGVEAITVTRRLKLASVSPRLLDLYRDDKMTLEQLMQFTLTDDHDKQEAVWKTTPAWQREPRQLRKLLTAGDIPTTDPVARYVGIEAYQAAGGEVRVDLLSDDGEGFLADGALLDRLALAKLDKLAEKHRATGWKWVEARPRCAATEFAQYRRISPGLREPTPKEARTLEKLKKAEHDANQALEATQGNEIEDAEDDALLEALNQAETARYRFEETLRAWTPEQLAAAGVIVTLSEGGRPDVHPGLVRAEDQKTLTRAAQRSRAREAGETDQQTGKPEYSDRLTRTLTAHRNAALQALLIENPNVALVTLTHGLVLKCCARYDTQFYPNPLEIKAKPITHAQQALAPDVEQSKAGSRFTQAWAAWEQRLPEAAAELFAWLQALPLTELNQLLALCVASSLWTIEHAREQCDDGPPLAQALKLDMADWWEPTAATYLNHVSKAQIVEAVTGAKSADEANKLPATKKADLVAAAETALKGTHWVPELLRH